MSACANPEFDARTDTVYSLDTPSVTAKAYPGVNVVSWKPVAGAASYKVTVYEEGVFKGFLSSETVPATDINIANGKKYTYYVEAVSTTNPGTEKRTVYAKNSRGEASVTAIVPPAGTSALELPAYEGGYSGTAKEVKDDKFVVNAENVKISVNKGMVYVNIPTKAYLMYSVDIYDTDLSHEIPGISSYNDDECFTDFNSNNVNLATALYVYSAGKYKVAVSVYSYNKDIYKYSEIEAGEIEIEGLTLDSQTGKDVSADYLSDGKTARIEFTPAKKDGVYVPTSWYKVYRHAVGEYATAQISGAVKEAVTDNYNYKAKYYIDDEIADTTKAYQYIVVVENDGKYGTAKEATLNNSGDLALNYTYDDASASYLSDGKTAHIEFTPATTNDSAKVPTSWYKVYRRVNGETETTLIGAVKANVDSTKYYVDDEIADTTKEYQYIIVVENNGKYGRTMTTPLYSKPKLDLDNQTSNDYAYYLSDGKTVCITFTPAKKGGVNVPTDWYKVYRRIDGKSDTTLVSGEVKKYADSTTYYIYDEIADTTKAYVYIIVVEKDGKYGDTKTTNTLGAKTDLSTSTSDVEVAYLHSINHFVSNADNTVRITFTPATKDGEAVPTDWYKVYRNEEGKPEQTEITTATNKIMQYKADPNTYVIYDADKSIEPAKTYVYTVVVVEKVEKVEKVENDEKIVDKQTKTLYSLEKPTISIGDSINVSEVNNVYNDIKWTFIVNTNTDNNGKSEDVSNVKLEAYIFVAPTTQSDISVNEIIAKGEKISASRDTTYTSTTSHRYECSKSNLPEGNAYFVVKATCDGYKDTDYKMRRLCLIEKD